MLDIGIQGNVFLGCLWAKDHHDQFDDGSDVKRFVYQRESTVPEHAKIKQVINKATQKLKLSEGHVAIPLALLDHGWVE